ncbi:unnamed protein product [Closterium sp. NIES-65]|nr:unnamed protein product [Closterium sp. NIES-65]
MDSSRTHIHDLLDDVLLRILWPSERSSSCTSESDHDDLWNPLAPRLTCFAAHDTPEEPWRKRADTPMPTPPASADAAHNLFIASICRRWRRLAQRHVSSLLVKDNRVVSHRDVLNAAACFPRLTHLHLSDFSVETLDDAFLADLAVSCPGLRALHVGMLTEVLTEVEVEGKHERNGRVITESGLDFFFRHCSHLEHLSMCCLEENLNPPASFFQLQHLRTLILSTAFVLKSPDLSALSSLTTVSIETSSLHYDQLSSLLQLANLTRLALPDDIRVISAHPPAFSLAQLPTLQSLKFGLDDAHFTVFFPPGSPFRLLKRLHLSHCFTQERLPSKIGQVLPHLQELSIIECENLSDLTDEFTSLTCLESLTVSYCSVSTLPEGFGNLPALKVLVLHQLPLRTLPASFTRLASLEAFFLDWCERMNELPAGFGRLTALQSLSFAGSAILHIPEDLGGLTNLQTFRFEYNSKHQLLSSLAQLPSLTRLELVRLEHIELPEGIGELTNLQELHIQNCFFLKEISGFVTSLVSLRVLRITECDNLVSVSRRLDGLTSLTQLELRECWQLIEAPQALPLSLQALCEHLSGVRHLELVLEEGAEESLSALTRLPRLRTLTLREVCSLNSLVEFGGSGLRELRELNIIAELPELPAAITTLHHLTSIQIYSPKLSSLPHAFGAFSRLRKLDLSCCSSLTHLPASLTQLSCLHELNVTKTSIRLLPSGFAQLSRLRKLVLNGCEQLEALPDDISEFRMLEYISTSGCVMLWR